MKCVTFESSMYVWTGKGTRDDAFRVKRGQVGILLSSEKSWCNVSGDVYHTPVHFFLLEDGRVAWTPQFTGIKIVEMYCE